MSKLELEKKLKSLTEKEKKELDKKIENLLRDPSKKMKFLDKLTNCSYYKTACEMAGANYNRMDLEDMKKLKYFVYLWFFEY